MRMLFCDACGVRVTEICRVVVYAAKSDDDLHPSNRTTEAEICGLCATRVRTSVIEWRCKQEQRKVPTTAQEVAASSRIDVPWDIENCTVAPPSEQGVYIKPRKRKAGP